MKKEEIEVISALIAGQAAALVHLSIVVAQKTGIDKSDLAESYRNTARLLDEAAHNREIIALSLNQVAAGIDSIKSDNKQEIAEQIKSLLH